MKHLIAPFIAMLLPATYAQTVHSKVNEDLGLPNDLATAAVAEFIGRVLRQ